MPYLTAPAGLPIEQISGTQTVAVDFASEIVGEGFSKVITAGVALSAFATCNGSLFAGAQAVRESGCVVVQNWVAAWLCGCVVVWLCGCVVASLCGRVVVWSCGRAVAWLRSCVVAWLRPCVVWSCGCVAACCAWLPPSPLSPPLPPFTSLVVFRIFRLLTTIFNAYLPLVVLQSVADPAQALRFAASDLPVRTPPPYACLVRLAASDLPVRPPFACSNRNHPGNHYLPLSY